MRRLHQGAKVESLGRCPLFDGLSRKQLAELARMTEDVEVPAGAVVWHEHAKVLRAVAHRVLALAQNPTLA